MTDKIRLRDIAGYCAENAIWKMVTNLCGMVEEENLFMLAPDTVVVAGDSFIAETHGVTNTEFQAPEYEEGQSQTIAQQIWTIGALIYYASSGHILFGGYGGLYQRQHPKVQLPALQKAHRNLTPLMQKCLAFEPSERINLEELGHMAQNGLQQCLQRKRPQYTAGKKQEDKPQVLSSETWPEEMIEL